MYGASTWEPLERQGFSPVMVNGRDTAQPHELVFDLSLASGGDDWEVGSLGGGQVLRWTSLMRCPCIPVMQS